MKLSSSLSLLVCSLIAFTGAALGQSTSGYTRHTLKNWGTVEVPNSFKRAVGDDFRKTNGIPDWQENSPAYAHLKGNLFIFIPKTMYTAEQRDIIILRVEGSRNDEGNLPSRYAPKDELQEWAGEVDAMIRKSMQEGLSMHGVRVERWVDAKPQHGGIGLSFTASDPTIGRQSSRIVVRFDTDRMLMLSAMGSPEVVKRYEKEITHFLKSFRFNDR